MTNVTKRKSKSECVQFRLVFTSSSILYAQTVTRATPILHVNTLYALTLMFGLAPKIAFRISGALF